MVAGGKKLDVKSSNNIAWYPKIVFFDAQLNVIEIVSSEKLMREIQKEIPKGAKFVKIVDNYLPITTKNGLEVVMQ